MADETRQRGLGRGLQALLGEAATEAPARGGGASSDAGEPGEKAKGVRDVPIEFLKANPNQPRRHFDETELDELSQSIKERGLLQPIIVRPIKGESAHYEIVAGERRWRAAQKARQHTVPVIVRELTDSEVLEIAIVENVQRADLNALEEALGYQTLIQQFKYTQDQLSKMIGKSRSHVANMTRLLTLSENVQDMVRDGKLSAGHARALVGCEQAETLAREMVEKSLNVRQAEALVRRHQETADTPPTAGRKRAGKSPEASGTGSREKDTDTLALERDVSNALGLPVTIEFRGEDGGDLRISYSTLDQLDDICRRLAQAVIV